MTTQQRNNLIQLLAVVLVVVLIRVLYVDVFRNVQERFHFETVNYLARFFENIWAVLLTFVLDTVLVVGANRKIRSKNKNITRLGLDLGWVLGVSIVGLVPMYLTEWVKMGVWQFNWWMGLFTFLTLLLINLLYIAVLDMVLYFRESRNLLRQEHSQKEEAQYRYALLKAQLNPHFLFNSLNMLDYLVQNDEKEHASEYIRKLAGVYRYLLRIEKADLVPLAEEKAFVESYLDLLQERFREGLIVQIHIEDEYLKALVVPLSLQVLVENAVKHNIVNKTHPLVVEIGVKEGRLFVCNTLQVKESMENGGLGLRNLNEQYCSKMHQPIEVIKSDRFFKVLLPIQQEGAKV